MDEVLKAAGSRGELPTVALVDAVNGVNAAWLAALGGAATAHGIDEDVDAMSDAGMLRVCDALSATRRIVDALQSRISAGIADRSRPELGKEGLARRTGHRTPVQLIATSTGGHPGDAHRLIQVGEATTGRMTFSGERAPARHPHVAAALTAGTIGVAAASAITTMLDRVALRADRAQLDDAEQALTEQAALLTLTELNALLRRAEAYLDPDGLEPRLADLRSQRSLRIREEASGMISLTGLFDPESAAPIKTVIDALVTAQLRATRTSNPEPDDAGGGDADAEGDLEPEQRSIPQRQADALADICRHMLACDDKTTTGVNTTIIVRIPLDALTTGTGIATIDGISQPIDAGTARRMAGDAQIIPCVLGRDSEILDFGRAQRLFTPAQKLALAERDGGCAFCGAPPHRTEGHHLQWWKRDHGTTDISNGILLCSSCHHLIHDQGWEIRIDPPPTHNPTGGTVWFIPPPHVNPRRTPRLGGRRRHDYRLAT
jgi:hypothetical protein